MLGACCIEECVAMGLKGARRPLLQANWKQLKIYCVVSSGKACAATQEKWSKTPLYGLARKLRKCYRESSAFNNGKGNRDLQVGQARC